MAGRNLFESIHLYGIETAAKLSETCVFISHKKEDKQTARDIAEALMGMGVDIYFDEKDRLLKQAAALNDEEKIVKCIEEGLNHCTHLLGIITENTKRSWWVPYEIGGATGRRRTCAHLITKEVTALPAYIKVATILPDVESLDKWLPPPSGRGAITHVRILERLLAAAPLHKHLPQSRSLEDLKFLTTSSLG